MTDILDQITPNDATEAPKAPESRHWRREDGEVHTLWLDCAGTTTNVISEEVLRELDTLLDDAAHARPEVLVIRSAK